MTIEFDPRKPDFIADPFPMLASLREADPVHWSDRLQGWVVTRYDHNRQSLRDPRLSSDRMRPFFDHLTPGERAKVQDLSDNISLWAVFNDPPQHTRLRGLMNKAFTSRALNGMRPRIAAIVDELLDAVEARGEMDLIRDFAYPLPATVIADMLGVPRPDVDLLKQWSDDLGGFVFSARLSPDKYQRATRGIREITDYFRRFVEAKRKRPGDDVTSGMIAAEESGSFLSVDELVAACVLLLFAGHETTTQLIGNGFLALLNHPDQLAEFRARRADAKFVEAAVEELLRYDGPTLAQVRVVAEDFELDGKALRKGQRVFQMLAAANRDPLQFEEPDRLILARGDARHLTFGFGIHFCVGAPLARMEGQIAFPALLDRLGDFRLLDPTPQWSDSLVNRGVDRINLAFRQARAA